MEILNSLQKEVLNIFQYLPPEKEQFYFTGGTCLSLIYLQHRKSLDLDFFTPHPLFIQSFSLSVEEKLKERGFEVERKRSIHSFVELLVSFKNETTIIHFAQDSPFRLEPVKEHPEYPGVKIDSFQDISANKILALFGRALPRDFLDIYFISQKIEKDSLLNLARKKDPGFDLYWFGIALEQIHRYTSETFEMHLLLKKVSFLQIRNFFEEWQKEIFSQLKGKNT
ncbi:nucleotidyl transferase AbiEii/AbiGii toxin family protein [Candidatus Calescamantes bacterium]|nr:nucleotidyl transferase AbiEii/AbiGii toxin family protein [Candidatus Calescamantes bacterium]